MVKETRIVFEVGDLIAFRIVCEECGGEAVRPFTGDLPSAPSRCPWCGHLWQVGQVDRLVETIRNIAGGRYGPTGLRLELDGEAVGQPDGGKL